MLDIDNYSDVGEGEEREKWEKERDEMAFVVNDFQQKFIEVDMRK